MENVEALQCEAQFPFHERLIQLSIGHKSDIVHRWVAVTFAFQQVQVEHKIEIHWQLYCSAK